MAQDPKKATAKKSARKKATAKKAAGKITTSADATSDADTDPATDATYDPSFAASEPRHPDVGPERDSGGDAARQTTVNSQIIDTIQDTARAVKDGEKGVVDAAIKAGLAQSLTMALQDATEHLRRTQIIAESATAMGLKRISEGSENGKEIMEAATASVTNATQTLANVGDTVAKIRKDLDIA